MTQVTLPGGQAVGYGYDALGRRAGRAAVNTTTTFLYDDADVVLDRASDNSQVTYLNGPGIANKLRQTNSQTGPLYFLQDQLGSTSSLARQHRQASFRTIFNESMTAENGAPQGELLLGSNRDVFRYALKAL